MRCNEKLIARELQAADLPDQQFQRNVDEFVPVVPHRGNLRQGDSPSDGTPPPLPDPPDNGRRACSALPEAWRQTENWSLPARKSHADHRAADETSLPHLQSVPRRETSEFRSRERSAQGGSSSPQYCAAPRRAVVIEFFPC